MTRKYEQRTRADSQHATRQRIVEAAIELHGTRGPGRTSLSAVAERAGVQRNTLYRHFPDERSLLLACSGLHTSRHPLPSPDGWDAITDPEQRTAHGLSALYASYEDDAEMTRLVLRDAAADDLVREIATATIAEPLRAIHDALAAAWPESSGERAAALRLALAFSTWESLVRGSGLDNEAAARMMAAVVAWA